MKGNDAKRRWRPGLLGAALAMVLGALVLAGCGGAGGGSSSTETSTTASASSAGKGGAGAFDISEEAKTCLREKGVELPEFKKGAGGKPPQGAEKGEAAEGGEKPEGGPPSGGFGGGSEKMKKAFKECGVEVPEFKGGPGGKAGGPNVNSAAFKKQVEKYVACVRENGYELPEPNFSGEGPVFEKSESESAAFKKASAQCQSLLGGPQGS